jgi:hypothetical protein
VSTAVIVSVLTGLAGLVVVLSRLRLARDEASGTYRIGRGLVNLHTISGLLGLGIWITFLIAKKDTFAGGSLVGIVALFFWWVTALLGLLILMRWLPSRGKHAGDRASDRWSSGPWLSLLGHLGLLCGVCFFTFAYLNQKV